MNLSVEEMVQLVKENMIPLIRMHDSRYQNDCMDCSWNSKNKKRSQKLLEFNDVPKNLKSALENEEIQHYIGQKYDYLFIDEFQDTNPLQWEIVKRMTKENRIKLIVVEMMIRVSMDSEDQSQHTSRTLKKNILPKTPFLIN